MFWNSNAEIHIGRAGGCKNKEQCQKREIYIITHKEKLKRIIKKNESEVEIRSDE
jgi:hypothetical protein